MYPEVLPSTTVNALARLRRARVIASFLLGGGTALALQLGHRLSKDLDFFARVAFTEERLVQRLVACCDFQLARRGKGTVGGWIEDTWLSFLYAPFPLLDTPKEVPDLTLRLLSLPDLAAMKVLAVAQRGSRRDFIDLYVLHHQAGLSLEQAVVWFRQKYADQNYNLAHVLRALGYLEDAESEPMPTMLRPLSWHDVRVFFLTESRRLMAFYLRGGAI